MDSTEYNHIKQSLRGANKSDLLMQAEDLLHRLNEATQQKMKAEQMAAESAAAFVKRNAN